MLTDECQVILAGAILEQDSQGSVLTLFLYA
jgi:hypothetical protein